MNREIKFRGKTIPFSLLEKDGSTYTYEGEMVFGFYHKTYKDESCIIRFSKTGMVLPGSEVDPKSVSQFSGVQDKNKIDCYESDIIKFRDDNDNEIIAEVVFCEGQFSVIWEDNFICIGVLYHSNPFEIIGNSFENPDLLVTVSA